MEGLESKQRIFILSLHRACENSSYYLSKIETFLKTNEYEIVGDIARSNIVIINTCAYSDKMQLFNEKVISEIVSSFPDKIIFIYGCLVHLTGLHETDHLIFVKNSEIDRFSEIFSHVVPLQSCHSDRLSHFDNYQDHITRQDYFVQICQGCCNQCSYCNIKLAKGEVKSRPVKYLQEEVRRLVTENRFEITLLADDCGSYGYDIGSNIVELMSELINMHEQLRFKIYTIFPNLLLKYYEWLRPFFKEQRITYVCAPLQSGSTRILKLMNRDYNFSKLKECLKDIKTLSPNTYLFTHFMINFPTETIQDFEKSLELAGAFDSSMFIPYQENKRTLAYRIRPKCTQEGLTDKINRLKHCINHRIFHAVLVGN